MQDGSADDAVITLRYPSAAEARRDRLPDVPRGVIARTRVPVREGEERPVRIELAREKLVLRLRGRVRWATPLASGALAGLELEGPTGRQQVQLDLLLGIRSAARTLDAALRSGANGAIPAALPRLSVVLLEPSWVLREVLTSTLVRLARDGNGWDLQLDAVSSAAAFLDSVGQRRRNLAVVDCDGLPSGTDALLDAVRARPECARLPIVVLSQRRRATPDDDHTVTMEKPVAMKALLETAGALLRGAR